MSRFWLVALATILGTVVLCARLGIFPGLVVSSLLCLVLSWIAWTSAPSREKAAESELKARAKRFRALGRQIRESKSASRLAKIGDLIDELIGHIRRDPRNLDLAAELIVHYLPKAQELVEEYVRLVDQPSLGARRERELADMENTIQLFESALETQNRRLLDQDVDSFNVDRRGFEEMLRLDFTQAGLNRDRKDSRQEDMRQ